ncbi:MAG: hypothetical protein WC310_00160 [Patescibacteria group bacterium]|jgi:hypothetical protein
MSLICIENGRDVIFGETLMAATRPGGKIFSALSPEVIDSIPETERKYQPSQPGEGGVHIHLATSDINWNGAYTVVDFALGEFFFSISEETAVRYLPNFVGRFPATA